MSTFSHHKVRQGLVVSDRPDKTISVLIERKLAHPRYGKYYKRSNKILAHDPLNACNEGDLVKIVECRPISKLKSWRLLEILERKA